jgi:hypothetical protein
VVDDPILLLERELVDAARRRTAPPPVRRGRPHPAGHHLGSALAIAASVIAVVAVGAAVLLTGRTPASRPGASRSRGAPYGLSVLARPQTAADRDPATLRQISRLRASAGRFVPDPQLMRLAAVAPWGQRIVLVPFHVLGSDQLMVFVGGPLWGAAPVASIATHGIQAVVPLSGAAATGIVEVVPNGVATVSFAAPEVKTVTAPVSGNVAAFALPTSKRVGLTGTAIVTWYSPSGRVIRRVQQTTLHATVKTQLVLPRPTGAARTLIDSLGILRRPQTSNDLNPGVGVRLFAALTSPAVRSLFGTADLNRTRLATITPWGQGLYVMPFAPPRTRGAAKLTRGSLGLQLVFDEAAHAPALGFYIDGDFGCCASLAMIKSGQVLVQTPFNSGAPGLSGPTTKVLAVVPDGVARVVFTSPSGLRLTAAVHGNVAAAQVAPSPRSSGHRFSDADTRMTWYDAAGRVIPQNPN